MKSVTAIFIALFFPATSSFAQETSSGGIVYGPKAAFKISAPSDWVLDNSAGVEQGLPCVLYPEGSSWQEAKTIMYAKIASPEFIDVEAFAARAMKEMKDKHGTPKQKIESGKNRRWQAVFYQRISGDEVLFPMGTGRVRPVAGRRRLHRVVVSS